MRKISNFGIVNCFKVGILHLLISNFVNTLPYFVTYMQQIAASYSVSDASLKPFNSIIIASFSKIHTYQSQCY